LLANRDPEPADLVASKTRQLRRRLDHQQSLVTDPIAADDFAKLGRAETHSLPAQRQRLAIAEGARDAEPAPRVPRVELCAPAHRERHW
jgi:hypothetical protein